MIRLRQLSIVLVTSSEAHKLFRGNIDGGQFNALLPGWQSATGSMAAEGAEGASMIAQVRPAATPAQSQPTSFGAAPTVDQHPSVGVSFIQKTGPALNSGAGSASGSNNAHYSEEADDQAKLTKKMEEFRQALTLENLEKQTHLVLNKAQLVASEIEEIKTKVEPHQITEAELYSQEQQLRMKKENLAAELEDLAGKGAEAYAKVQRSDAQRQHSKDSLMEWQRKYEEISAKHRSQTNAMQRVEESLQASQRKLQEISGLVDLVNGQKNGIQAKLTRLRTQPLSDSKSMEGTLEMQRLSRLKKEAAVADVSATTAETRLANIKSRVGRIKEELIRSNARQASILQKIHEETDEAANASDEQHEELKKVRQQIARQTIAVNQMQGRLRELDATVGKKVEEKMLLDNDIMRLTKLQAQNGHSSGR